MTNTVPRRDLRLWLRRNPVKSTASVGFLSQAIRSSLTLLTIPAILSDLGQERFAVWLIALSLIGIIGIFNAGLNATVITMVGRVSTGDQESVNRLANAAHLVAMIWGSLVAVICIPVSLLMDWRQILHLGSHIDLNEIRTLMVVLVGTLSIGFVTAVPRQIMYGQQRGYLTYVLDIVGLLLAAVAMLAIARRGGGLWQLGLAYLGPQYIVQLLGGNLFMQRAGIAFWRRRYFDRRLFLKVGRDSANMSVYQAAYAVSSQSDLLLIGIINGAGTAAAYGIAQRVFGLMVMVATTVNYAQWPVIAQADAANDTRRVTLLYYRTAFIGGLGVIVSCVLVNLFYSFLIHFWLKQSIATDPAILLGMSVWAVLATFFTLTDTMLRAFHYMRFIMFCMLAMAVVNLGATLVFLHLLGPAGAIWGTVAGMLAILIPYVIKVRKHLTQKGALIKDMSSV